MNIPKKFYKKDTMKYLLFATSLYLTMIVAMAVPMSLPQCNDTCGNVLIPYPFGIGSNCSANSNFTVTCQNTNNNSTPRPVLTSINMEVLHFSVVGTITVNQRISPMDCSDDVRTLALGISLLGSPFTISAQHNSLANLGCINTVWLRAYGQMIGGCTAFCDKSSTDRSCNGVNCCQMIPSRIQGLELTYRSSQGMHNDTCGYAFLVDKKWFREEYIRYKGLLDNLENPFDPRFRFAPMVLEWELESPVARSTYGYCEYLQMESNSYYMSYLYSNQTDYPSSTKLCYCDRGFEGNPYLNNGCQDINECTRNGTRERQCPPGMYCINYPGTYVCSTSRDEYFHRSQSTKKKIVLISIGSGLGALFLLLGTWRGGRILRRKIKANRKKKFFKRNGGLLLEKHLSSINNGLEKTKLFSSKELAKATDHYNENRILGRGGQGTVYKGMLTDGSIVAIKKSKKVEENDLDVFINEVVILSLINHRNVVKLLGCCLETEVPLLVYEFIPNGTLFKHIHDRNEEFPLSWEMRFRIAVEVAGALSYLHSAASTPIYHRDIKSTNILLDDKYRAKVADFGTSRSVAIDQTHLTTRVLGTFGYLDPEYFQSSQFTEKSDVYSFGVVMVELLTGEKAITSIRSRDEGKSLATHFLHAMEENKLVDIVDAQVLKEGKKEEIIGFAELAKRCLHLNGKRRPTMREVAVEMDGIKLQKQGVISERKDEEHGEFHSIDMSETYDCSTNIQESMRLDTINVESLDAHPLLIDD